MSLEVLAEVGVEAFTLREAARRAGVNHRAVYRHYADKTALLAAIAQEGYRALTLEMASAATTVARDVDAPREALLRIAEAYVDFARREPAQFFVIFGPRLNADGRFPSLETAAAAALQVVRGVLEQARPATTARARRDGAITLWASAHGFSTLVLLSRISLPEEHTRRYLRTVLSPVVDGILRSLES